MKHFNIRTFLIAIIALAGLSSCNKDKNTVSPLITAGKRTGIYILNQGGFGANNGSLTYYNYFTQTNTPDIFKTVNTAGLGDTPNDMKVYGSKMYVVVNVSNVVDVIDPKTAKLIKQISFAQKQPRSVAFYKNNAFVTSYDGTVSVIDTASLAITKSIAVGLNPEQLVVANNKLYVANSGGLTLTLDKTVSVIDLNTLAVTKTLNVIVNPVEIAADAYGHVYVISNGDYNTVFSGISVIDDNTDTVLSQTTTDVGYGSPFVVNGDSAYYVTGSNKVVIYNVKTQTATNQSFITDGTTLTVPYGIAVDNVSGEVFITDAKDYKSNGTVTAFDKSGKKEYSLTTGINPANMYFLYL